MENVKVNRKEELVIVFRKRLKQSTSGIYKTIGTAQRCGGNWFQDLHKAENVLQESHIGHVDMFGFSSLIGNISIQYRHI
jgi:hypothetical protein